MMQIVAETDPTTMAHTAPAVVSFFQRMDSKMAGKFSA
jgi:hypothetical protein